MITDRKNQRHLLKFMNGILKAASGFSIVATDVEGSIILFNRGFEIMLGYSGEEIVGKTTPLMFHLESEVTKRCSELTSVLGRKIDGFEVFIAIPLLEGMETREWTYVRKDGSKLKVSLVVTVIHSEDGGVAGFLGIATDITEKRRAEDEAANLAEIIRHSSELVNLSYLDGKMAFLNEAGSRMLGINQSEVLNTNIHDVIPDSLKDFYKNELIPVLSAGNSWVGELQYRNLKTGKIIDTLAQTFVIEDKESGTKKFFANVSLDISDRKKAEEKFTKIFIMTPDGISITRISDGVILDSNPGFEAILGWKRSEAVGRTSLDLKFWADWNDRKVLIKELRADKVIMHREIKFCRKDGEIRDGAYSARVIDLSGEECVLFIMQDITERKKSEDLLRQTEEMFSMAFHAGPLLSSIIDIESDTILAVNDNFTRTFGYSREDLIGKSPDILNLISYEDRMRLNSELQLQGHISGIELKHITKKGDILWGLYFGRIITISGKKRLFSLMENITERKLAEEKSRQSEDKFLNIFMGSPDTISITRLNDGLILDVNLAFEEITGWKREEAIGRTTIDLNFWFEPEERELMINSIINGKETVRREFRFRRKNGIVRYGIYSARILVIEGEKFIINILTDITERKETERALQENEKRIRAITDNIPGVVYQFHVKGDGEYELTFTSERMTELFGVPGDADNKFEKFVEGMHREDLERFFLSIRLSVANFSKWNFEGRYVRSTGELMWFNGISTPSRHGDLIIFDGILLDITERKKAEEMFRQSEETFSRAFQSGPLLSTITEIETGKFIEVNKNFELISGFTREEAIGKTSIELGWISTEERARILHDLNSKGRVSGIELLHKRKNGDDFWGMYFAEVINISGRRCILSLTQDITGQKRMEGEQRKLEQQLLQAQKLDAVGELAGGIAHDFNNILSGIFGFTELSLQNINNPERLTKYLNGVLTASGRARELVNQILAFSRYSDTELQEISPGHIIKEAFKLLRATIPATIELIIEIRSNSVILGDQTQLHQVIVNLCANAAYSMRDKKGTIIIALKDITIDEVYARAHPGLLPGKHVELSVSDDGSGIEPEVLDRIFEPFYTTKPPGEGTGLGLSVVHGIIKKINGVIDVCSKPGEGTTFTVILPVVKSRGTEVDIEENWQLQRGSERILLIDDEIPILETVQINLADLGYKIDSYSESSRALDAFQKYPDSYDLVITDYTMSAFTGIDIAVVIKDIRTDIPVILCSGYMHKDIEDQAQRAGISKVLRKPVSTLELVAAIRKLMDRR